MSLKIDAADKWFSMYVRLLAGECRRCHSLVRYNANGDPISHQASHFQGRRKEATRYDMENVDSLCGACHLYFTAMPYEHVEWQKKTKGENVVQSIIVRSNGYKKKDRAMEALVWKKAYSDLLKERKQI